MLIGLCGPKGHGKDTFASFLIESNKNYLRVGFADSLKKMCGRIFGLTHEQMYDPKQKESSLKKPIIIDDFISGIKKETGLDIKSRNLIAKTPRELLQFVGTEYVRSIQGDYWVSRSISDISTNKNVVISDVRFPNESKAIKKAGGKIIKIFRLDIPLSSDNHASEVSIDESDVDMTIGTVSGDFTIFKKVAWLIGIGRFNCANKYNYKNIQKALSHYIEGGTLKSASEIMGYTGKYTYAFKNMALYYSVPLRSYTLPAKSNHKIINSKVRKTE